MQRTYQTRLNLTDQQKDWLSQYAALFGRVERTLFAETLSQGVAPESVKNAYLQRFGLTSRQFNAISRPLKGKVKSLSELRKRHIKEGRERIKAAETTITKLSRKLVLQVKTGAAGSDKTRFKLHHKKRRLNKLRQRQEAREADATSNTIRLCFGSKKLFRAQFDLAANGYASYLDWKTDWASARSRQFYVLGSKDESAGCQSCQLAFAGPGSGTLALRLPHSLVEKDGPTHVELPLRISRGAGALTAALEARKAISYRFVRDNKGWRVFITTDAIAKPINTRSALGAIGVDLNADHLAVAETDRFGNPIRACNIPMVTHGLSTDQADAVIGDAIKALMAFCEGTGKPLVIEKLDFSKKKASLEKTEPRQARRLSSLQYNRAKQVLLSRAFDQGMEVKEINPAYTSVIGLWKFAGRYRLTGHQAAALAIARRGLKLSERPNRQDHNAGQLPARKAGSHVWSLWAGCARNKATFATLHERSRKSPEPSEPLPPPRGMACDRAKMSGSCMSQVA